MLSKRLINTVVSSGGGSCTTDTLQILGDSSCIAYYKMANASDETGSHNGTPTNVNFNLGGKFGNAATFNRSSSSKINIPQTYGAEGENVSYSFWFKTKTSGNSIYDSQNIISKRNGANTFHFNITNANKLLVSDWSGTVNKQSSLIVTDGVWRNVVFTYNNGSGLVYINGSVETSMSFSVNLPTQSNSNGNNIGNWDGTGRNFGGSIDQVRIFNKTVSSSEVTKIYNEVYCLPTIVPSENFNTVLWSNNANQHQTPITGVGFRSDMTWIKMRDAGQNHVLTDSLRGVTKTLFPNTNDDEETVAQGLTAFNSDGFALGNDARFNSDERSAVAWNWYSPTSETNTDSINSTIKKNVAAGFSLVKYTGSGNSGDTIAHGLTLPPEITIIKKTSGDENWYYQSIIQLGDIDKNIRLDEDGGLSSSTTFVTAVGNSTITLGGSTAVNGGSTQYLALCFRSIAGYSKVGSYKGLGGFTGPLVVTGFKPAFILIKDTAQDNWAIIDNKRSTANPRTKWLRPNLPNSEFTNTVDSILFNSNGFQVQGTATSNFINESGNTFIFLAIAETVFNPNGVTRNATNPFGDSSERAFYQFEDNATDSEGNFSSTILPNVTFATGYINKAAVFNGSNAQITLSGDVLNGSTGDFSISFWFKCTGEQSRIFCSDINPFYSKVCLDVMANGTVRAAFGNGTNAEAVASTTTLGLNNNKYNHIVYTMTRSEDNSKFNLAFYVNGYFDSNHNTGNTPVVVLANSKAVIGSGFRQSNSSYPDFFTGSIDQVRIFNKAIDSGEALQLYNE